MKKKYCVFCGTKNDIKNETCSKCKNSLNPKDHLWKDYFKSHIKDNLKDKVEDKISSIITNYITSHLYGIVFSILFIATVTTGVVAVVKENKQSDYIKIVEKSPIEITELALDDALVEELNGFLILNQERFFNTGFYDGKKMTYNDLQEKNAMVYQQNRIEGHAVTFHSCEEAKKYPNIYEVCQKDSSWVVGEDASYYRFFSYDDFNTLYKKMFGNDKNAEKISFNIYYNTQCDFYENLDEYLCYNLPAGWYAEEAEFTKLIKVQKVNDWIEYYDIYVYGGYDGTYKDLKKKEKISNILIWDDNSLVEKGQIYKHIFKDNGNGEYYWVSSEPVNNVD